MPRPAARPPRRDDQHHQECPRRGTGPAHRRRPGRRASGRDRRPFDRPLRRPGPALRSVLDRYRQEHGRHQAGRPEAICAARRADDTRTEHGFGRFTPRARGAVVAAQNAAHEAGNSEITPAHLLLGVLSDAAALATVLLRTAARRHRKRCVPPRSRGRRAARDAVPPQLIPFSGAGPQGARTHHP